MTAVAVRDRPILMSGPMVRAILEDRKTKTRRVAVHRHYGLATDLLQDDSFFWAHFERQPLPGISHSFPCPYGQPGDRLWVKETFMGPAHIGDGDQGCIGFGVLYRADDTFVADRFGCGCEGPCGGVRIAHPWKPSIFMPRRLSRLTLDITEVRVERVQDISEEDAKAEGCARGGGYEYDTLDGAEWRGTTYVAGYRSLWDSLNAKRGYGWDVNPWVWVIAFKRVDP